MTIKSNLLIKNIGKESRDVRINRGIFESMMERKPKSFKN